jgi:hypothetical protein
MPAGLTPGTSSCDRISRLPVWAQDDIVHDSGLPKGQGNDPSAFTIGHNVGSLAEVDALIEQACAAGAAIVKPAQDTFYGGPCGLFPRPSRPPLGSGLEPVDPAR